MGLRSQNLTPLQRHLLTLLSRPRQGQVQPWIVLDRDCVSVEPVVQVLRGRAAVIAAKGLRTMGWLRARPGGGLELTAATATVAEALEGTRKPEVRAATEVEEVIERTVAARLNFSVQAPAAQV